MVITSKFRYCYLLPSVLYCIPVGPFFIRQAGKYSVDGRRATRAFCEWRKLRNRLWPGAKSIWELIRDDCGRRGAIHEIAGSSLSSLSSFFAAFHRRRRPVCDKFLRDDAPLCRLACSQPSLVPGLESCEKLPIDDLEETRWSSRVWIIVVPEKIKKKLIN